MKKIILLASVLFLTACGTPKAEEATIASTDTTKAVVVVDTTAKAVVVDTTK